MERPVSINSEPTQSSTGWVGVTCGGSGCHEGAEYIPCEGPGKGWVYHGDCWLCPSCVQAALDAGERANEEAIRLAEELCVARDQLALSKEECSRWADRWARQGLGVPDLVRERSTA